MKKLLKIPLAFVMMIAAFSCAIMLMIESVVWFLTKKELTFAIDFYFYLWEIKEKNFPSDETDID